MRLILITALSLSAASAEAGNWSSTSAKSPMDDSVGVYVSTKAVEVVRDRYGRQYQPKLTVGCHEHRTLLQVDLGGLVIGNTDVEHRVDDRPAQAYAWDQTTAYNAVSTADRDAIIILKEFYGGKRLLIRTIPVGENAIIARFNIDGLAEAIKGVRAACAW